jgi:type II secretory ATPase GspE/PulE/Tfp pilus assembly ATPase PilB-like protein
MGTARGAGLMKKGLLILLLAGWIGWISSTYASTVYLTNGKSMEGIVRDSGGSEVEVITPGGTFSFPKSSILRIERTSDLNNLLMQARSEETRGNYQQAISLYSEAISLSNSPSEKNSIIEQQKKVIQKYIQNVTKRNPLTEGLSAIQEIENLKRMISDSSNLALLQSARMELDKAVVTAHYNEAQSQRSRDNYEEAINHYKVVLEHYENHTLSRNLDRVIADLYLTWGEEAYRKRDLPAPNLQEIFQEVLKFSPDNARSLYYLGKIAYDNNNYIQAKEYLQKVDSSALSPVDTRQLNSMLSRINVQLRPTPVPTPVVVQTPVPKPTPVPGPMKRFSSWVESSWDATKKFGMDLMSGSGSAAQRSMDFVWLLLVATAALIVLWYIPMRLLLNDLPKRRVVYHNWRKIVKYTGILGLLFYYIDRWRREEPRKRCPACNRTIDDPDLFDDYDFTRCPYCEKQIKPPFTLPEIIQNKAHGMVVSKALAAGGPQDEAQREMMLYLLNLIMIHGRKVRASDIHIEPEEANLLIRYRVDGVMTESIAVDHELHLFLVSSIKVICNMNIAEKRLPQDGHFRRVLLGDEINVRVSTIPTRLGEKVVMRLLDHRIATATLDSLGLRSDALDSYRNAIRSPHGLILATGPTGSGKTTLQYASLQFINDGSKNITTVEDPIEYELEGINQVQHNTATGLTFATALRSILRQDPDVIMVGEIRDLETASIAVNAALTGHLVFSTLHTIDTSTALSRLIDIGVDVKLLQSAILCIVAQRLVRKLCPHCKKETAASAREIKALGRDGILLEGKPVFKSRGCRECSGTGFIGRTGIYEMLVPNRQVRALIEKGASAMEIRQASHEAGMKSLREEGILKILRESPVSRKSSESPPTMPSGRRTTSSPKPPA